MLKILLAGLLIAAAYAVYDAGGVVASKDKAMAFFDRVSKSALGGSNDWG
ncbi:MAG: hypothetical protein LC648_02795 [Novosphingobium sp.]|nr:hypothetical protein [Novosphingobium sp.]